MEKLQLKSSEVEKYRVIYTEKVVKDGKQEELEICHGTLIINFRKAINADPAAIIEDVWTEFSFRKKGHGRTIVQDLIEIAKDRGCYKVILNAAEHNWPFYQKIGFKRWQTGLKLDLMEPNETSIL